MNPHNVLTMPPTSLDAALDLTRRRLSVVPVPFREKGPKVAGWQTLRLTESELPKYFTERSQNVGVLLGINGLTDIDKDCEEATYIADMFLPETGLVFGRHSAPRSHSLYYSDPPLPQKKFEDPVLAKKNASLPVSERTKSTIIEIRGTKSDGEIGLQTVFPPSVHVAGECIEYARGSTGVAENVDADQLQTGVSKIAAAILLARYFPSVEGGRNQAFLCINGVLVRSGWTFDDVYAFSLAIRRILYRDKTKESHCRAELEHTMREYAEGKPLIGIPTLKDVVHPDAVRRAFEWLQVGNDVSELQNSKPCEIIVSKRPNHAITADAIRTLQAVNEPPYIFIRGTELVKVINDEDSGSAIIRECSEAYIRGEMDRAASYIKFNAEGGMKLVPPSLDIVRDLMARPSEELKFPRLKGIVESPIVLGDGRIVSTAGYDSTSGILYMEQPGFKLPDALPENPVREDAIAAREFIESEILVDFPFEDDSSRHNALAALVTVVSRSAITGPVPICVIDATSPGTGKGLLTEAISLITTGRPAGMSSLPRDDDETRKAITSALMRNPGGQIVFDNITGSLSSDALAQALTANTWRDRVLGSSRTIEIPVRCTWFANGNNIDVRGDLARRCYSIRMDAKCSNPFQRQPAGGFRHPELLNWISVHRGEIVAHLLTICRAWFVNGRPTSENPVRLGSFEQWIEIVGGILAYAGATRFMSNAANFYLSSDSEAAEWEVFLTSLWRRFPKASLLCSEPFTVAQLLGAIGANREFASTVPAAIAPYLEKGMSGAVSIGKVLDYRRDRRYGRNGLYVSKFGKCSPVKWVVRGDAEPAFDDEEEKQEAA